MTYEEWKSTLIDAQWDKINEAILNDEENDNLWADDHEYLIDAILHFGGKSDFVYDLLEDDKDD